MYCLILLVFVLHIHELLWCVLSCGLLFIFAQPSFWRFIHANAWSCGSFVPLLYIDLDFSGHKGSVNSSLKHKLMVRNYEVTCVLVLYPKLRRKLASLLPRLFFPSFIHGGYHFAKQAIFMSFLLWVSHPAQGQALSLVPYANVAF